MPNTYIKAEKYAALAVAALQRDTVLPNIVTRYDGGAFVGALDDKVFFKLPGVTTARDYEWRTRTAPIVLDKIGRTKVEIELDTHTYNAIPITDEELTLDVTSFSEEILLPQLTAVRDRLEVKVVTALRAAPFVNVALNAAEADDPYKFMLSARRELNSSGAPQRGRVLLVGANVEEWILASDRLQKMDPAGAKDAYREAVLARGAGFDILTSSLIGDNDIFALHPSWAVLSNVAPAVPEGVTYGAIRRHAGYGVRVIRDYDPQYLRDRSVVSTFTGISSVNDQYATTGTAENRALVLDGNGNPTFTGSNPRGARGTFTPTP